MTDIVVTEFLNESALIDLKTDFDVHYDPELYADERELLSLIENVPALIVRNRTQVNVKLLTAAAKLKVIGRLGVGLDNIDMSECAARGVQVHPATGANVTSVAEYVIGSTLLLLRGCFNATNEVLNGEWPRNKYIGREAAGKKMGLIGFGAIGRAVAARGQALDMFVSAYDANIAIDDPVWRDTNVVTTTLEALLVDSDVVSLHVPLAPETRNLIAQKALSLMKSRAILINTSRGGVVNEEALVNALRNGTLAAASLDVYEEEPLPANSVLTDAPNLVLTPHVGGVTEESNERVGTMIAALVRQSLRTP